MQISKQQRQIQVTILIAHFVAYLCFSICIFCLNSYLHLLLTYLQLTDILIVMEVYRCMHSEDPPPTDAARMHRILLLLLLLLAYYYCYYYYYYYYYFYYYIFIEKSHTWGRE